MYIHTRIHTYTYIRAHVHRGEFLDNEIHGKGTLQGFLKDDLTTAFVYMGDMQHGKMHGGACLCISECMYVCMHICMYHIDSA